MENETLPTKDAPQNFWHFLERVGNSNLIKNNLVNAFGRLIGAGLDVPVAYLEQQSAKIRAKTEAIKGYTAKIGEIAGKSLEKDESLQLRASIYYADTYLREQTNREKVVENATQELLLNPPTEAPKQEIDADWLAYFETLASAKSNEEMQVFLGKILAGEIKQPNTFSLRTLHTLSMLDQETAKIFQDFCNLSAFDSPDDRPFLIYEPFGEVEHNKITDYGLDYFNLCRLRETNLIGLDLDSAVSVFPKGEIFTFFIGNKLFKFNCYDYLEGDIDANEGFKFKALFFTEIGQQLRSIMNIQSNEAYNAKIKEWLASKFGAIVEEIKPTT